jgi:hypothetical protein
MQVGSGLNIDKIIVPPGGEPVCLSDEVNYESLKTCDDLFKLIRKGVLKLFDPDEAEAYYVENPERRTANREKIDKLLNETKDEPVDAIGVQSVQISNRIIDTCLKLRHEALGERGALEQLFENMASFNMDDYSYLFANGKFPSIKKWAKEQMNRLSAVE